MAVSGATAGATPYLTHNDFYGNGVDFDGDVRGNPPDIGADEFAGGVLFLPIIRR